jgi:hypothetical protein
MEDDDPGLSAVIHSAKSMIGNVIKIYKARQNLLEKDPSLKDGLETTAARCKVILSVPESVWPTDMKPMYKRLVKCIERGGLLETEFKELFPTLDAYFADNQVALKRGDLAPKRGKKRANPDGATEVFAGAERQRNVSGVGVPTKKAAAPPQGPPPAVPAALLPGFLRGDALNTYIADCEREIPHFKSQMDHSDTFDEFQKALAVVKAVAEDRACTLLGADVRPVRALLERMTTAPPPCCSVCAGVVDLFQSSGYCMRHYFDHIVWPRTTRNFSSSLDLDLTVYERLQEWTRDMRNGDAQLTLNTLTSLVRAWDTFDSTILARPPREEEEVRPDPAAAQQQQVLGEVEVPPQPPTEPVVVEEEEVAQRQPPLAAAVVEQDEVPAQEQSPFAATALVQEEVLSQQEPPRAATALVEEEAVVATAVAPQRPVHPFFDATARRQTAVGVFVADDDDTDKKETKKKKKRERTWEAVAVERVLSRHGDTIPDGARKLLKLISGDAEAVFNEQIEVEEEEGKRDVPYAIVMVVDGQPFMHSRHASWQEAQDAMPPPCEYITYRLMKC